MKSKLQPIFNRASTPQLKENEYDIQRILKIIRRYNELRSAAEITTTLYGHVIGGSGLANSKDDIICTIADIDRGLNVLSPRQQAVVKLLKKGYLLEEISKVLGIKQATVKLHIREVGLRLTAYLNRMEKGLEK